MCDFEKGSEWRRWDLHLHTPGTLKNDQFKGSNGEEKWTNFYKDITDYIGDGEDITRNISVVAITDYVRIDNYKKVVEEKRLPTSIKLILPNVEFRMTPIAQSPINIHCIFDPNIVEELETRFFSKLKITYNDRPYVATNSDLIRLGRDYKHEPTMSPDEALKYGCEQFVLPTSSLKDVFDIDKDLREKTVVIVSNGSNDGVSGVIRNHKDYFVGSESQLDVTRQSIYQASNGIFSANEGDIKYFLGEGVDSAETVKIRCGSLKPCFHGCDAHINERIFNPSNNKFCWVKADPTFAGLKQAINEPRERVFIGGLPDKIKQVSENRTKYITEININTYEGKEDPSNIWFKSVKIPLNCGLVAIIGNKGSGKSAVSDIIGLCASSEHSADFSFLNKTKFLKKGYAERFYANIKYLSGTQTENKALNQLISSTDVPQVQYLPQNYFETLCNEVGKVEYLRREIEKVAFQYISEEKRLKKSSFEELIDFESQNINKEILQLKSELSLINNKIMEYEDQSEQNYYEFISKKLQLKAEELRVHTEQKPPKKDDPNIDQNTESTEQRENLSKWRNELENINNQIKAIEEIIANDNIAVAELKQLRGDIDSTFRSLQVLYSKQRTLAEKYQLNIEQLISFKYNTAEIDQKISKFELEIKINNDLLKDNESSDELPYDELSLKSKVAYCIEQIRVINIGLTSVEQEYQDYLSSSKRWEEKKDQITGDTSTIDSLKYYVEKLRYIKEDLPDKLAEAREERLEISRKIYNRKNDIKVLYDDIKQNVSAALVQNQNQNLTIDSSFSLNSTFIDDFMSYINKSKVGSFRGQTEGAIMLKDKLLTDLNLEDEESVIKFLKDIIVYLEQDKRTDSCDQNKSLSIKDQIPKRDVFYSFIFSLDYITPHYELRQNGKDLEKLSPGEKGALLLVFYLVLDKSDTPLLIDQPEDNLDNQSVVKILVPFIKLAKQRRQIIMVTHNPNLAVVADAEEIIHVDIDKNSENNFMVTSGSIENTKINKKIVDVLEGTLPAFISREQKYFKVE